MISKLYYLKTIIILIIFQILSTNWSYSDTINKFVIEGNDRIADETIIMFSELKIGDEINSNILNNALKNLYYTDYFKKVELLNENETVFIIIEENPIVQSVDIEGIKENNIYDIVKEVTNKIEKYPFVENKINEQIVLLKNILKSYGYYFVKLNASINKNDNNTVNLIYNFELGEIAKIKKINFIGDKIFNDTILRNIIISEETKFWKFITRNKFLDANRVQADISRLNTFYKNRGYHNVKIKSTTALITNENQFER